MAQQYKCENCGDIAMKDFHSDCRGSYRPSELETLRQFKVEAMEVMQVGGLRCYRGACGPGDVFLTKECNCPFCKLREFREKWKDLK